MPERWLNATADMEQSYVPFGIGSRQCLGLNFAMASLATAFAVLFRRYDFELVDVIRERDVDHRRTGFMGEPAADSPGMRIRVTKS